jgi:hypothetical protein
VLLEGRKKTNTVGIADHQRSPAASRLLFVKNSP